MKNSEKHQPTSIIKMPKKITLEERQNGILQANGIPSEEFNVVSIERSNEPGIVCVTAEVSLEFAELLAKRLSVRLHDPEERPGRKSLITNRTKVEFEIDDVEQITSTEKWKAKEEKRRSKPKSDKSDVPDH